MKILKTLLCIFLIITSCNYGKTSENRLESWREGYLDIHFISTGTGNCAFAILPDGTTLLIDAGELDPTSPRVQSPRNTRRYPDYSKHGFKWQAGYIKEFFPAGRKPQLDYAFITHYHEDHYGCVYPGVPESEHGEYFLSGITGVGSLIPINKIIDRGDSHPYNLKDIADSIPDKLKSIINYWKFIDYQKEKNKLVHETFEVGSKDQFALLYHTDKFPEFSIRNINANGVIWSGKEGKENTTKLPPPRKLKEKNIIPDENTLSCGILIQYGKFRFYTGGDIHGKQPDYMNKPPWYDIESYVAPVVGEVDVTTANHHANRDAMSACYLSILKPRVIIQEVWSSDHPGHEAFLRMISKNIWPDERDLFATNMLDANRFVIGEQLDNNYKSMQGHIVLRVLPGGDEYYIYILNHLNTIREVTGKLGPYQSK